MKVAYQAIQVCEKKNRLIKSICTNWIAERQNKLLKMTKEWELAREATESSVIRWQPVNSKDSRWTSFDIALRDISVKFSHLEIHSSFSLNKELAIAETPLSVKRFMPISSPSIVILGIDEDMLCKDSSESLVQRSNINFSISWHEERKSKEQSEILEQPRRERASNEEEKNQWF